VVEQAGEYDNKANYDESSPRFFHFAWSGDHDHIKEADLEEHFKKKFWPTQLLSIRSQITKSTLDSKCQSTR
jgi:hypothetical protein